MVGISEKSHLRLLNRQIVFSDHPATTSMGAAEKQIFRPPSFLQPSGLSTGNRCSRFRTLANILSVKNPSPSCPLGKTGEKERDKASSVRSDGRRQPPLPESSRTPNENVARCPSTPSTPGTYVMSSDRAAVVIGLAHRSCPKDITCFALGTTPGNCADSATLRRRFAVAQKANYFSRGSKILDHF